MVSVKKIRNDNGHIEVEGNYLADSSRAVSNGCRDLLPRNLSGGTLSGAWRLPLAAVAFREK